MAEPIVFSKIENYFILQGIQALQAETVAQRTVMVQRIVPADDNVVSLLEYYDKRTVQLAKLEKKISALFNTE